MSVKSFSDYRVLRVTRPPAGVEMPEWHESFRTVPSIIRERLRMLGRGFKTAYQTGDLFGYVLVAGIAAVAGAYIGGRYLCGVSLFKNLWSRIKRK